MYGYHVLHTYDYIVKHVMLIDDVRGGEKGCNCKPLPPVFCSLVISNKQSCELSRHGNWDKQSSHCVLVICDVR